MKTNDNQIEKTKMVNTRAALSAKNICYIAVFVCIIIVCTYISIPFAVPFTMQTFAIALAVFMLGGVRATVCVLVYLLLGIVGVPVFSGLNSGIGAVLGATGGFLIGFIPMCLIGGLINKFATKNIWLRAVLMLIPLAVLYAVGAVWFVVVFGGGKTVWAALLVCVIPFVIPDAIKIFLASIIAKRCEKAVLL